MSIQYQIQLESGEMYELKDHDPIKCEEHNVETTWGELDFIQRAAVLEGIDSVEGLECLLSATRKKII